MRVDEPGSAGGIVASHDRIFSKNFVLACLTTLCSFSSFYLLLATLPVYVLEIGGDEAEVGRIIGVFSATAVVLRLLVGRAADRRGRRMFILAGTLILTGCSALYGLMRTVSSLLGLRVAHGIGWATSGTAVNALVADIVPPARRGEAMGYYGMFNNLAMAIGPALGVLLMKRFGFIELFWVAALVALLGLLIALPIRDATKPDAPTSTAAPEVASFGGLIERGALFPSVILALAATTYGAIMSFLPIYGAKKGLANPGLFFTVYAVTLVAARGITGLLSDRFGRAAVIAPGLLLAAVALGLLSVCNSVLAFLGVAVVYGIGFAAMQPALMALVVDRSAPNRRGVAMGMFATAMDLGIGGGSLTWGVVARACGYERMYAAASGLALLTLVLFVSSLWSRASPAPTAPAPTGAHLLEEDDHVGPG